VHVWEMPALRRRAHRVLRPMWSDDVNGLGWGGSSGPSGYIIESSTKVIEHVCRTKSPQDFILLPAAYYFLAITRSYRHLPSLPAEEKRNLLAHITALDDMYHSILNGVADGVPHAVEEAGIQHSPGCRDSRRWRAALGRWTDARFESYGRMAGARGQVFDPLEELGSTDEFKKSLTVLARETCNLCAERLKNYLDLKRFELWEDLPQRFDLPKWKDLRESLSGWVPDP